MFQNDLQLYEPYAVRFSRNFQDFFGPIGEYSFLYPVFGSIHLALLQPLNYFNEFTLLISYLIKGKEDDKLIKKIIESIFESYDGSYNQYYTQKLVNKGEVVIYYAKAIYNARDCKVAVKNWF